MRESRDVGGLMADVKLDPKKEPHEIVCICAKCNDVLEPCEYEKGICECCSPRS